MDSYCTIYIKEKYTLNDLLHSISKFVGGRPDDFNSIKGDGYIMDFVLNPDYGPVLETIFPDGFLYFKYRMEISFNENTEISYCIQIIGKILVFLWNINVTAIASSDYEHLLPESGGYKSTLVPWDNKLT